MQRSTTVIVAPMTSTPRSVVENPRYLVAIAGRESGLTQAGFVECDQLATLPVLLLDR